VVLKLEWLQSAADIGSVRTISAYAGRRDHPMMLGKYLGDAVNYCRSISFLLVFATLWTLTSDAVSVTMNKCKHPDGHVEFTDQPCPSDARAASVENKIPSQQTIQNSQQNRSVAKSGIAISGLPALDRLKSCDPRVAITAAEEIVSNPAYLKEPMQLFSPAFTFFQNGKKNEGVFWFYAAQLRVRQQMLLENGDRGQILSIMLMTMGPAINNYAFQNTSNLNQILDRVLEWDKTTANPFREQAKLQKLEKQMEQVYAGLGDLKKKIITERNSMEAAARLAAPEIENMQAHANSQRCPKDQPDPMYIDQITKSEESLAIDFAKTNQKVIQAAGENLRVYPSMRTTNGNNSLPSRYSLFVKGKNGLATAVVDVNRAGGKVQFYLACITDERSTECPK
jgi:hypothetical protein